MAASISNSSNLFTLMEEKEEEMEKMMGKNGDKRRKRKDGVRTELEKRKKKKSGGGRRDDCGVHELTVLMILLFRMVMVVMGMAIVMTGSGDDGCIRHGNDGGDGDRLVKMITLLVMVMVV